MSSEAEVGGRCSVRRPSLNPLFEIKSPTSRVKSWKPRPRVEMLNSWNDWCSIGGGLFQKLFQFLVARVTGGQRLLIVPAGEPHPWRFFGGINHGEVVVG